MFHWVVEATRAPGWYIRKSIVAPAAAGRRRLPGGIPWTSYVVASPPASMPRAGNRPEP